MSKPMTKTQLVAALAEKMDTDKKSAVASLDAICDLITSEVRRVIDIPISVLISFILVTFCS